MSFCEIFKTVIKCVSKLPGYVFEFFENQYSNVSSMRQFFCNKISRNFNISLND